MTKHSPAAQEQSETYKTHENSSSHMLSHHCTCPVHLHTSKLLVLQIMKFCICAVFFLLHEMAARRKTLWDTAFKKMLWPPSLVRELAEEGMCESGFYTIWQSVSQHGALSCVKYLAALPSNSQSGCLESLVDFRPLLACFLVSEHFLLINKPSTVRASATFTGIN